MLRRSFYKNNVFSLPGKEALYDPGKRNGQMKMIREGKLVIAYTWVDDGDNSHWEKVGEVMGGTDKDDSGKTVYEGNVSITKTRRLSTGTVYSVPVLRFRIFR